MPDIKLIGISNTTPKVKVTKKDTVPHVDCRSMRIYPRDGQTHFQLGTRVRVYETPGFPINDELDWIIIDDTGHQEVWYWRS